MDNVARRSPGGQKVHQGLLPSVRALLDYLGTRFGQLRED
jgi:hypothetical protein